MLVLKVRDRGRAISGQLDYFTSFTFRQVWAEAGGFSLTADISTPGFGYLFDRDAGIVLVDDETNQIVYSGQLGVARDGVPTFTRNTTSTDAGEITDTVTFTGNDDKIWIAERVAHPQPGTYSPPYGMTEHDVRTGAASTVIWQYINVNAGPGAANGNPQQYRSVQGLTMAADPAVGPTITGRARWQNLGAFLLELALQSGVGYDVLQSASTGSLVTTVSQTVDRSNEVMFSLETGNLDAVQYGTSGGVNVAYGGGQGEGVARSIVFIEPPRPAPGDIVPRRVERFIDRRDIPLANTAELTAAVTAGLAALAGKQSLTFEPIDTPTLKYGIDYFLGDKIGAEIDGTRIVDVLSAVETTITVAGLRRKITVGREKDSAPADLFANLQALGRRLTQMERR
jgi:Siphovirus ReqiPepy6 Gp37-like protein